MFKKILIANRGAIACRIIRTLKSMNITSVAIYAEADRDSLHVAMADEAYSLGDGKASDTYLAQDKILSIAQKTQAEAIHPGYGFLSENATFVKNCDQAGITFIGPSVANMAAFALKHTARELATKNSVPLVPGSDLLADKNEAVEAAKSIGYPIILKSSAGGGGIGMQICHDEATLLDAFESVVKLSENNFSDGRVFLEKYIEHARHIEVQIFGNGKGEAVAIGERDCTLQRRNQKVIEEAPAPNLDDSVRQQLHQTAVALAEAVQYRNAGTVEFILDTRDQGFYFLEVNTRLQVEHGVTEEVYGVDLVAWMVEQAWQPLDDLITRRQALKAKGHAIQVRVYAENPAKNFQPSAGLLSQVRWPEVHAARLRIDTWVHTGIEVSPFFDPMLAKVIVWAEDRNTAIEELSSALEKSELYGIVTNIPYCIELLADDYFREVKVFTRYLDQWKYAPNTCEILAPGTMTTVQDIPGRIGYWEVGVPPSGPYDSVSFSLGNKLLHNEEDAAGLEITISGPSIQFNCSQKVAVCGADIDILLDDKACDMWHVISVEAGQTLSLGKVHSKGARTYLLFEGGIQCPDYLGSKSTFTLGQFGGHNGRALKTGDSLQLKVSPFNKTSSSPTAEDSFVAQKNRPRIENTWVLNAIYGPHGAPDFFTDDDITEFFKAQWEVHYNSSRTGIRLIGPKPQWARESGGEAGMHPSNIHDNAYAFGSVDFTGDMPVILGPDGPSLGGFVCPTTVINADLWKLGQMRAGDKVRFNVVNIEDAVAFDKARISGSDLHQPVNTLLESHNPESCILAQHKTPHVEVNVRAAGDRFILVEFGEQKLDLRLRFYVFALREFLNQHLDLGIVDLTPGIRSLQIHFDPHQLPHSKLLALLEKGIDELEHLDDVKVPSRIVHLPLSWNDEACQEAVEKYMQSVRQDAPWCPDNIEFIRRINGLESLDDVKKIVFDAHYVVMGLGDVYLGAPVATPYDPRHRLVTTKYNPARTWTAENSVGIGGAYMCVYGMEGPGGYQFIGRTLQMWNRYHNTEHFPKPWLLRFFDQIKFVEVSHDELVKIREDFPLGKYPLKIEHSEFSLREYEKFLEENQSDIETFKGHRQSAFDEELQRWRDNGQFHFESESKTEAPESAVPEGLEVVESAVAGSVWKVLVASGDTVSKGQTLLILESMKMEIEIVALTNGTVDSILKNTGDTIAAGQALIYIRENTP